jgi:hypothetical protein
MVGLGLDTFIDVDCVSFMAYAGPIVFVNIDIGFSFAFRIWDRNRFITSSGGRFRMVLLKFLGFDLFFIRVVFVVKPPSTLFVGWEYVCETVCAATVLGRDSCALVGRVP